MPAAGVVAGQFAAVEIACWPTMATLRMARRSPVYDLSGDRSSRRLWVFTEAMEALGAWV